MKTQPLTSTIRLFLGMAASILAVSQGTASAQTVSQVVIPPEIKSKIKHVIIIYPENRSFDSMYGSFPGANGFNNPASNIPQVAFDTGAAFPNGYQPNTNGLRPPAGQSSSPNVPDVRFPAITPNAPYDVPAVSDSQVLVGNETGDLIHRFYLEQYQINNPAAFIGPVTDPKDANGQAPMSKYAAFSTNPGLVLGHFDASNLPNTSPGIGGFTNPSGLTEGTVARQYVMCDNAFHSGFGGSFLNHQWLIAARSPVWLANPPTTPPATFSGSSTPGFVYGPPAAPTGNTSMTVFDANGFPIFGAANQPLYPGTVNLQNNGGDGASTNDPNLPGFPNSNDETTLNPGDYWQVNTTYPLQGPGGGYTTSLTGAGAPTSVTAVAKRLPLQTYDTIGDRLTAAGKSWAWYSGGWDDAKAGVSDYLFQYHHQPFAFFAKYALARSPVPAGTKDGVTDNTAGTTPIPGIDSPGSALHLKDADKASDPNSFINVLKNNPSAIESVVFIKPIGENNEHPGYASIQDGQNYIGNLVAAIQQSSIWSSTVIFIMYDEHGGQFDHVVPPIVDRWGPGTRIPFIVASPFCKQGFVDHTQYETDSLLGFIEGLYSLTPLNSHDANANVPLAPFQGAPDLFLQAKAGQALSYQFPNYSGYTSFSATGRPNGLSINPTTGLITGTPIAGGTFTYKITATAPGGSTTTTTMVIFVAPPVLARS